jgi:hypothetical protein
VSVRLIANSIWSNPGNRGSRLRRALAAVALAIAQASQLVRPMLVPNKRHVVQCLP